MNLKRIISLLAAAAVITAFSGCSSNQASSGSSGSADSNNSSESSVSSGSSTDTDAAKPSVLTADIAPDKAIAYPTNGAEGMEVSFEAFLKEYKYFLAGYGLTDDTNETNAQMFMERRQYIVSYLINEKIIAAKFNEAGLTLTDEDREKIKADVEENEKNFIEQIKNNIASASTTKPDDDELTAQAQEKYNSLLTSSGLTEDDTISWQTTTEMQKRLSEYINRDFTLEYSEAEQQLAKAQETAKTEYESSPEKFNTDTYGSIWLPEGTRRIKHILIMFDEETVSELRKLRAADDDEAADKLRAEKAKELENELAEVQRKIDAGESFEELMNEYSDDVDTTATYTVAPKAGMFIPGFAECAMAIEEVGGISTCLTDYGYHIIKYTEPAVVTEEEIKETTDEFYEYLIEVNKENNFTKKIAEWRSEYNYTIENELLLIEEADKTSSEVQ